MQHISSDCKCRFDIRKCNLNQKRNNYKCWCEYKNWVKDCGCKETYVWNPNICNFEISRYLKSIANDLVITYDKIIDVTDTVSIDLVTILQINDCHYLLFLYKTSLKTKIHFSILVI